MSLLFGALGGMGEAGMQIGMANQKAMLEQEADDRRNTASMEREKTLMRLKMDLADEQRVKRAGDINAGANALIGAKMEGHGVADPSTWTPEMESARNAGMESMKTSSRADVAAGLGYMDEAKTLQDIQSSKDTAAYHSRNLDITEKSREDTANYQQQKLAADKSQFEQEFKLRERKANADIAHNAAVLKASSEKLSPAMEFQMKGAAHAIDLASQHARDAAKNLDVANKDQDLDGKKAERVAQARADYEKSISDYKSTKKTYDITGVAVFGDKWKTIESPDSESKQPKNSWNNATGEVFKDGKAIGKAKSAEEAKNMLSSYKETTGTPGAEPAGTKVADAPLQDKTRPLIGDRPRNTIEQLEAGKMADIKPLADSYKQAESMFLTAAKSGDQGAIAKYMREKERIRAELESKVREQFGNAANNILKKFYE